MQNWEQSVRISKTDYHFYDNVFDKLQNKDSTVS